MRIVPSDVVRQIELFFPNVKFDPTKNLGFTSSHRLHFASIVELIERIPEELITLTAEDFCVLQTAVASTRCQIDFWREALGTQHAEPVPGSRTDFVSLVYLLLSKCPDEAPASTTAGLEFSAMRPCNAIYIAIRATLTERFPPLNGRRRPLFYHRAASARSHGLRRVWARSRFP